MDPNLFYDSQLNNPNITWRLYAQPNTTDGSTIQDVSDYSELIAVGILKDSEINVDISHRYNTGTYDPFRVWETIAGLLPGRFLKNVGRKFGETVNPKNLMPILNAAGISANSFNEIAKYMNKSIEALGVSFNPADLVGSQFVSAFDLVSTFDWSDIDIELPTLETIWFHDQNNPVRTRINKLQNRLLGDLDHLGGLFGLQKPPNNYLPKLENLDEDIKFTGTFRLKVGNMYDIDNLVVTSFNYYLSTKSAMKKDSSGKSVSSGEPLYALISIKVAPAAFLTKAKLNKYMGIKNNV